MDKSELILFCIAGILGAGGIAVYVFTRDTTSLLFGLSGLLIGIVFSAIKIICRR